MVSGKGLLPVVKKRKEIRDLFQVLHAGVRDPDGDEAERFSRLELEVEVDERAVAAVGDDADEVRLGFDQLQGVSFTPFKQAFSFSQNERIYHQPVFIHQVVLHQRMH